MVLPLIIVAVILSDKERLQKKEKYSREKLGHQQKEKWLEGKASLFSRDVTGGGKGKSGAGVI